METTQGPGNINVKNRVKQILILAAIILAGIVISQTLSL
jgi:hypothetical protein